MPFQISPVDPRVTPGFEVQLSPAPTVVDYPRTRNGDAIETPDGKVIIQQPTLDARTRRWIWRGFPGMLTAYEKQYQRLQTFRSRYRQEAGSSPYVWVRDTVTKRLRRRVSVTVTAAASGNTTTAVTLTAATTVLSDAVMEVISGTGVSQTRNITSMTTTVLTVPALSTIPNGATIRLTGWVDDWFKVRVTDLTRSLVDQGGNVRYDQTVLEFVIDDASMNDLG